MYLLERLETEMCAEESDAVLNVSLTVNKSTATKLMKTKQTNKTWYGEQVLTKEDILSCGSVKASPQ